MFPGPEAGNVARQANPNKEEPVSEGARAQHGGEGHSSSDSNTSTVENDKSPKGILAPLLDLDILPSPESDTTALESGGSADYGGPAEEGRG